MDKLEKSKHLENSEDKAESNERKKIEEEDINLMQEITESSELSTKETHLDLSSIEKIQTKLKDELSSLINKLKTVNSNFSNSPTEEEDSSALISQVKNDLAIIDGEVDGWIKNRFALEDHINSMIKEENLVSDEIIAKIKNDDTLFKEKQAEHKLRTAMWGPEITKYLKYESNSVLGPMEDKHFKQIQALEDELKLAKDILERENQEKQLAQYISIELKKVLILVSREISCFQHIKNLLSWIINELSESHMDFSKEEEQICNIVKELEENILTEAKILAELPNSLINLEKEDMLDKEMLEKLLAKEQDSDMRNNY